jgi:leucyl-tRNA synthetase
MMSDAGLAREVRTESDSGYSPEACEARWHDVWRARETFITPGPQDERPPAYVFADCPVAIEAKQPGHVRTAVIGDAHARYLRTRGRAVLFSVGFDSFGPAVEREAMSSGVSSREWARRSREQTQGRLRALGCSCDWKRTFSSCEPEQYRWTQSLFLAMLERGLLYRQGTRWYMRVDLHIDENERGVATLTGWDETAIELQRAAIGRVQGVEMRASTFGAGELTVFTPHADAIEKAAFVAISPAHQDIDQWTADPVLAERVADLREIESHGVGEDPSEIPLAVTDVLATVPGVAGTLPIVISPLVDVRFGATAVLGIPELDSIDRELAKRLPAPAGTAWKMSVSAAKGATRPAVRYRAHDLAVSGPQTWGAPVPLIDCPACGTVPVPLEDLPVRLPDDQRSAHESEEPRPERIDLDRCACPRCGGTALRDQGTIDSRMDRMWMWMPICVPPERRASAMMNDPEYARWLPVEQIVSEVDAAACTFERRLLAEVLQDIGELPSLPDREPFVKALMHQGVRAREAVGGEPCNAVDLDRLIALVGSDAVRLAALHAASPSRAVSLSEPSLQCYRRWLETLYGYAEPRLHGWAQRPDRTSGQPSIDNSDKTRRRLAHWCAAACEKVTSQLDGLEMQRATHNAMRLLTRIQDFESRVSERRAVDTRDREAIVAALLLLVRLLAPLVPHIAEELWSVAGNEELVGAAGWPAVSRPARTARG